MTKVSKCIWPMLVSTMRPVIDMALLQIRPRQHHRVLAMGQGILGHPDPRRHDRHRRCVAQRGGKYLGGRTIVDQQAAVIPDKLRRASGNGLFGLGIGQPSVTGQRFDKSLPAARQPQRKVDAKIRQARIAEDLAKADQSRL